MKKNLLITFLIASLLFLGCKSKYYREVPYKLVYDNMKFANTPEDSLIKDKKPLTPREVYLKEKYSIVLHIEPSELTNYKFYDYIDQFIGAKYSEEGLTKDSLNMAPFVSGLYQYAFKKKLDANPLGIFKSNELELFTGRDYLQEGDIVFFRYSKDLPVSDVGVYLRNNRILVTSKKDGLIISDFREKYFQLRYVCSGRLKPEEKEKEKKDKE